jgi:two-component system, cell cycle sensor histidine kinase and response regulator CckA
VKRAVRFNVLCVDDEVGIRELVRRCLTDDRLALTIAGSGSEALALTPDPSTLDLLVTDEVMPGMEGHELARHLRQANPDLKVLYLTGYADHLFEKKTQMWTSEAYLDKPFSADGLRQAVALLVTGKLSL